MKEGACQQERHACRTFKGVAFRPDAAEVRHRSTSGWFSRSRLPNGWNMPGRAVRVDATRVICGGH